jgi:signal transduction histidine kinase/DNA-binding response OmpR family regulator/ligand-binding sensor domain-containing protein
VPAILQDKQGFVWVATRDGLCRYDGQRFKVFQPDPDGRPSLSFAGINQIKLDRHGRIWINSERGDIDVFDPHTERFTNVSQQAAFRRLVKPGSTYNTYIDRQDRLWLMEFGYGLFCWDVAKKQGHWFHHQPRQASSISSNGVFDMQEDADGTIWLVTDSGLDRFDEASQRFIHRRHQPGQAQSLPNDMITAVRLRPNGELMLLSQHYLTVLQPRTGQLRVYPLPPTGNGVGWNTASGRQGAFYFGRTSSLFRFTDQQGVQLVAHWDQPNEECRSLLVDRTNVLWMGTSGAGIRTYNLQPSPFQKHRYEREFYRDLLTRDSLGLPSVSPAVLATLRGSINYNFRSTFDREGRFWFNVGTRDLYRLDRKTGQAEHFPLPVRLRQLDKSTMIPFPMTTDPQGRVWAMYYSTAFWFDESTRRWNRFQYSIPTSLSSGPIMELVVDEQALWLASQVGGLWRLDRHNGEVRQYVNRPGDATSLSNNSIYCLSADPADGNRLWIGTFGSGLCLFDKRTGLFRRFTQATGLPNNVVYSALPDRYGYLWVGTNKGLCRMNRRTFTTQTFTRDDGIMADEFNRYHYVRFPDGKILMGGLEGFTVFNPQRIGQDAFEPVVELTELEVNNQVIQPDLPGPDGVDTASTASQSLLGILPIQATNQLTLAHNQNYLTVQFAALQFNQPAKNRYRYRLEGLEENWKETNRSEAIYTNLPPGDYVLVVNASNTSGRWSRHVRKLSLTIQPPFWATWWAIGLYILMGLSTIWGLLQVYLNRIRLNQAIQLRQQETEQLRATNEIKARFFANISHEFRTPLTVILGMAAEVKRYNSAELMQKVGRATDLIERSGNNLLRLINQILDLSKLEAGAMQVQLTRSDIVRFTRYLAESFHSMAITKGIQLHFLSDEVSCETDFDKDKLQDIISNLLTNALKFTPTGGHIYFQLTLRSGWNSLVRQGYHQEVVPTGHLDEPWIYISVRDTGMGINADRLPHVFDRFFQVADRPAPEIGGVGIGLSLVRELVLLMNGGLAVRSLLGQGSEFVISLPQTHQAPLTESLITEPAPVTADSVELTESTDEPSSDKPVLLLVEDNDDVATYITSCVQDDYQVIRAEDGQKGIDQAFEIVPDLILSDVMMPRKDGFQLCDTLKNDQRTSHIPIVLLTAKAAVSDRIAGLRRGADAYLVKPFLREELTVVLDNLLQSRRLLQQRYSQRALEPTHPNQTPIDESNSLEEQFLQKLRSAIDAQLANADLSIDEICQLVGMSRTALHQKMVALTGLSVNRYVRALRLARAKNLLTSSQLNISEIAYAVGFDDPKYFSRVFSDEFGLSPANFRLSAKG